jgi:hypothetical protein
VSRDGRAFAAALAGYAAFYGAFFLRSLLSGNYIAPSDSLDFGVAAFLSPPTLWTDAMYSGYPIAADPQSLTWYPVLSLFRLAGVDWNGFLLSAYVIASATAFLLVRRLSRSALAGIFSGLVYGFSGVMLAHIGHFNQIHAAAWAPLGIYGLQLTREGQHRPGAAVTAFAFAMMWLAGHPQVPVYTAYLAAALVAGSLYLDRPARDAALPRIAWSALGIVLGLGIAAVAILPMVELGGYSHRAESNWELYISKALPPWQLIGLALPFAYGGFWSDGSMPVPYFGLDGPVENTGYVGLLPLALALAAPVVLTTRRREAALWLGIAVIAALLCLGAATPLGTLFFHAPGYASFRVPARHLQVVSLCLAVLSGLAFADLTRRREGWVRIGTAVLVTLAGAALVFGVFTSRVPEAAALVADSAPYRAWAITWPLCLGALLLACAAAARTFGRTAGVLTAFAALLIGVHVVDLTMLHYRMPGQRLRYADIVRAEAVPHARVRALRDELRPSGERVLASDGSRNQFLLPNLTRPWGVPAAGGTGSLGIERYLDVLGMGGPGDVYPETFSTGHRGLDLFSVRYALVREGSSLAGELTKADGRWAAVENLHYYENDPDTHYTLFRNARARPRAWCVPQLLRLEPFQVIGSIRSGHLPDGRGEFDPARVALAEPGVLDGWQGSDGSAEVIADSDQRRYLVRADAPCLLVLGEVFYPWWRATLDDADVEIARVNHAMLGVAVPAGTHVIRLRLAPRSVQLGGALTLISLLAWVAVVVSTRV